MSGKHCKEVARPTLGSFDINTIALATSTHGEHDIESGELVLLSSGGILGGNVAEEDRHVEDMVVECEVVAVCTKDRDFPTKTRREEMA